MVGLDVKVGKGMRVDLNHQTIVGTHCRAGGRQRHWERDPAGWRFPPTRLAWTPAIFTNARSE